MKIFKFLIKGIFSIFYTSIIILGAALTALFIYGIRPYIVQSGSMEPAIKIGSVCFINQRYYYENVKKNDVIAFELSPGKIATHRAINIKENGIETQGDANTSPDNLIIKKNNFIGKNLCCIPHLGYFISKLQTIRGKIMFTSIIIVIIITNFFLTDNNKFLNKKKLQD